MQRHRKEHSFEVITQRPLRKSRSETILRMLVASSYPHATLANLTLELGRMGGYDREELERVSDDLRNMERSFELTDFIRCVEIKRNQNRIQVVVKRLKLTPQMQTIKDTQLHHEALVSSSVELEDTTLGLSDPDALAVNLLELFYRTQVKQQANLNLIAETFWMRRDRVAVPEAEQVNGEVTKLSDTRIEFRQAVATVSTSLTKDKFHVIMTQNTILLLDQEKRLWGVDRELLQP